MICIDGMAFDVWWYRSWVQPHSMRRRITVNSSAREASDWTVLTLWIQLTANSDSVYSLPLVVFDASTLIAGMKIEHLVMIQFRFNFTEK